MGRLGSAFIHAGVWLGLGLLLYVFFLRQATPPVRVDGPGHVELSRARDGHFRIDGAIQGEPVRFLIDTGASTVSVSGSLARRAGIDCRTPSTFNTANGIVQVCMGRAARLDFGPFSIENVSVAILPKLASDALLGMNALRHLRLEQTGNTLRLSRGD